MDPSIQRLRGPEASALGGPTTAPHPHPRAGARCPHDAGRGRTHVQGLQAVPAEGVLAALAHHLGAAFVSLYVDLALGAALDGRIVLLQLENRAVGRESIRARPPAGTQGLCARGPGWDRPRAHLEGPQSRVIKRDETKPKK